MRFQNLLVLALLLPAQNSIAQIDVVLHFKNSCTDSLVAAEFILYDLTHGGEYMSSNRGKTIVPSEGTFFLTASVPNGDYVGMFSERIIIKGSNKYVDTLVIPKIKFNGGAALHSKSWSFFNCDQICNGRQIDYYPSGTKRLEGEFVDGKPKWIIEFRRDGTKESESWYTVGKVEPDRINHYNKVSQLDHQYVIKKNKKGRAIRLTFDSTGKLLGKEIIKHGYE